MLTTNANKLPRISVTAKVMTPHTSAFYTAWMDRDGYGRIMVGPGGITYNYSVGDNCMEVYGNMVEPGVSMEGDEACRAYACCGNEVVITSGPAAGEKGFVTGKLHATSAVTAWFAPEVLEKMTGNETFLIKAFGCGLRLDDWPDIDIYSLSPDLLERLGITETGDTLTVPVTHVIPSYLMGEGWGTLPFYDDGDIITDDSALFTQYNLGTLRFGDIVFIEDHDSTNGRAYRKGAGTVGVVVCSDGIGNGEGPGVLTLMSSKKPFIKPVIQKDANIALYLGIREVL